MTRHHSIPGGGGLRLHVAEAGPADAPPILFLHGFNQCGRAFHRQFEGPLAQTHRLVALDLRGHGQSEAPPDAYGNPRDWADDVAAVVDALALDRPVVVAWSYSGVVVLDFIRVHGPTRLAGLNLVCAVSKIGRAAVLFQGEDFLMLVKGFYSTDRAESEATLRAFLELCYATPPDTETFAAALEYNMAVPAHVRRGLFARRVDNDDLLARLDLPVLITHGMLDRIVLPAMAEHHARLVPGARLSLYEGVGHSPFFEAPQRFDAELEAFAAACRG